MSTAKPSSTIIGPALPNIPWEERPSNHDDVLWRSARNPIIPRDLIPSSNSIFNSAVVPFGDGFAGVFRCDNKARTMQLHSRSQRRRRDLGTCSNERIQWQPQDGRVAEISPFEYGYDPRVTWIEDRYYVTWCNGYHGPTIGVGYTTDFETFHQLENAYLALQPQRRALSAPDQRPLRHAQPPQRQRPHARSATSSTAKART